MNHKKIIDYLERRLTDWRAARVTLADMWSDAWAEYASTPRAYEWLRRNGMYVKPKIEERTGDIETDWKHRIHTGKVFEITEILWAYFMQATFSTEMWFKVRPVHAEDKNRARLINQVMVDMLKHSKFRIYFGTWLRQLLVTGTSCYVPTWCNKSKCFKHKVISNHRIYLNPCSPIIESDMFLATTVNRAWLTANKERYNLLNDSLIKKIRGDNSIEQSEEDTEKTLYNVDNIRDSEDNITLYEFWGTVYDEYEYLGDRCYAVMCDSKLIHFEEDKANDIIACNFIQLVNMPYGVSNITSSLGLVYADRSFLNLRLDNLSSLVHNVIEYVEDMVIDPEFKYFPGAKIPVKEKGSISSVPNASPQFPLSYQEEQALDSRMNRNAGTIPTVGTGSVRKAERVTAQEIEASRQVGGTRINQNYQDIEQGSINRMLEALYRLMAKYGGQYKGVVMDVELGEEVTVDSDLKMLCAADMKFILEGSQAVLTDENEAAKLQEFALFASQNEMLAQQVNWQEIIKRIADLTGFKDPEMLLSQPQAAPEMSQLVNGEQQDVQVPTQAQQLAINSNIAADGGASAINQLVQGASLGG
jgi:hypothetical protein